MENQAFYVVSKVKSKHETVKSVLTLTPEAVLSSFQE